MPSLIFLKLAPGAVLNDCVEELIRLNAALETGYASGKISQTAVITAGERTSVILKIYPWASLLAISKVAARAAYSIVLHDDFHVSAQCHAARELALLRGEHPEAALWHAHLTDRAAVNSGQPQVFGTQGRDFFTEWIPWPIIEPESVDQRRVAVGLEPLEEACQSFVRTRRRWAEQQGKLPHHAVAIGELWGQVERLLVREDWSAQTVALSHLITRAVEIRRSLPSIGRTSLGGPAVAQWYLVLATLPWASKEMAPLVEDAQQAVDVHPLQKAILSDLQHALRAAPTTYGLIWNFDVSPPAPLPVDSSCPDRREQELGLASLAYMKTHCTRYPSSNETRAYYRYWQSYVMQR